MDRIARRAVTVLKGRGSYANVASTLALVVALGGTGYAATTLAPHSVGTKQLKDGAVTSAKVKNFSLSYKDFQGGQLGLVLGYAHVNTDASVDDANSFGVTADDVQQIGSNDGYCFHDLPFTVHGAVVTTESGSSTDWVATYANGDPGGDCPGNNVVQATVRLQQVPRPTQPTSVSRVPIFIVFY
jgi:hypothetical protein